MALRSGLVLWGLLAAACSSEAAAPSESERLEARMDRTAVHFHLTLHSLMSGPDGTEWVRRLRAAADSEAQAASLAQDVYARRDLGRQRLQARRTSPATLGRSVPTLELAEETDRALVFLAMLAETADEDGRIPKLVLVHEAARLGELSEVDPALRRVALAGARVTFARAGYCDFASEPVARESPVDGDTLAEAVGDDLPVEVVETLPSQLAAIGALLEGGSRACCMVRDGRNADAATLVGETLSAVERLEVEPSRIGLLRAWADKIAGRRPEARVLLGEVESLGIAEVDRDRYEVVRGTLASDAIEGSARLNDRQWLSSMVTSLAMDALRRSGLEAALVEHPAGAAARQIARGEAQAIAAAREREPLFDQSHVDRGTSWSLSQLFR